MAIPYRPIMALYNCWVCISLRLEYWKRSMVRYMGSCSRYAKLATMEILEAQVLPLLPQTEKLIEGRGAFKKEYRP